MIHIQPTFTEKFKIISNGKTKHVTVNCNSQIIDSESDILTFKEKETFKDYYKSYKKY